MYTSVRTYYKYVHMCISFETIVKGEVLSIFICLLVRENFYFSRINIGDLVKSISYICLNWQLGVNFNVHVLHNWCSGYGSQSTSTEYLLISTLSLDDYLLY